MLVRADNVVPLLGLGMTAGQEQLTKLGLGLEMSYARSAGGTVCVRTIVEHKPAVTDNTASRAARGMKRANGETAAIDTTTRPPIDLGKACFGLVAAVGVKIAHKPGVGQQRARGHRFDHDEKTTYTLNSFDPKTLLLLGGEYIALFRFEIKVRPWRCFSRLTLVQAYIFFHWADKKKKLGATTSSRHSSSTARCVGSVLRGLLMCAGCCLAHQGIQQAQGRLRRSRRQLADYRLQRPLSLSRTARLPTARSSVQKC